MLTSAVEHMALSFCGEEFKGRYDEFGDIVVAAMGRLCSMESMVKSNLIGNFKLIHPSDGDFIALMKQDEDNIDFNEWYSRRYSRFAIWKSPDEFAGFFNIRRNQTLEFSDFVPKVLKVLEDTGLDKGEVLIKKVTYKPKVLLKSLYILVHKELKRYTEIYPDEQDPKDIIFYYVYVKKPSDNPLEIEALRQELIEKLRPVMQKLYPR